MMSSQQALTREGHLKQVLHILGYLKKYYNTELVFDLYDTVIYKALFERQDCASSDVRDHLSEKFPSNMLGHRSMGSIMSAKR